MRTPLSLIAFALLATGCTTAGGGFGGMPQTFVASRSPEVTINAPLSIVQSVILDGAAQRGSRLTDVGGGGLALEAPLAQTTPEVAAACGPHLPGRMVRVVLRAREQGERTRLAEERFIVDAGGQRVCPMPMVDADVRQAMGALSRVRETSEAVHQRFQPPTRQRTI